MLESLDSQMSALSEVNYVAHEIDSLALHG